MPMPQLKLVGKPMRFSAGNDEEFTEIFNQFYTPLCFFTKRLLNYDEQAAQDVVADVFAKLWEQRGSYENRAKIKAWLYITTRNDCFNYRKFTNKKNNALKQNPLREENEQSVLHQITRTEVVQEVYSLLESLPSECRKVMKLSFMKAYSNEQIAEMLSLSVNTVKNQKSRGVMLIRNRMIKLNLWEFLVFLPIFWD